MRTGSVRWFSFPWLYSIGLTGALGLVICICRWADRQDRPCLEFLNPVVWIILSLGKIAIQWVTETYWIPGFMVLFLLLGILILAGRQALDLRRSTPAWILSVSLALIGQLCLMTNHTWLGLIFYVAGS